MVDHDVILRGLSVDRNVAGPLIIKRAEDDFIGAVIDGLSAEGGAAAVVASEVKKSKDVISLFQPVHRIYHLALLEASCLTPGLPRLDPSKIESSGLVLRKMSPTVMQGWMQAGKKLRGWVPFLSGEQEDLDPDPKFRRPLLRSGNEEIDRHLLKLRPLPESFTMSESVSPLFIAPPAVCGATKRTILYGLIPVTSSERSEAPPDVSPLNKENFSDIQLTEHLPYYLRNGGSQMEPPVRRGRRVSHVNAGEDGLKGFVDTLRQLQFEFDAFGDGAESRVFFSEINSLAIDFESPADDSPRKLGDYLRLATSILALRENTIRSITIPKKWPRIEAGLRGRIRDAARNLMKARLGVIGGPAAKFESPSQEYRLRAFVRVRRDDGCPPLTVWSEYSAPFTIVPWYAPSEAPPVRIDLPDPFDKGLLNKLKPGVAFNVPRDLFNLINGDAKKLKDGEAAGGTSFAFDWICGFNIPLITICAFIVLYIFLTLLHIFLQWLFIIKICIPFPRKK